MTILILGNSLDVHAQHIHQALLKVGATVDYFNTYLFPTQLKISWNANTAQGLLKLSENKCLNIQEVTSIFWRSFAEVGIPDLKESYQEMLAFDDSMSAIKTLIKACPTNWVNSWKAYEFHQNKPLQLNRIQSLGIKIPQTLITNCPEEVIEFSKTYPKAIFKPVYGGAHTQYLTEDYLSSKRLNLALKISPITVQEYIPGTNIRSYLINQKVYSAEIRSQCLDFRDDENVQIIPIKTPENIQKQCRIISQALFLKWTGIDWRLTPDGEYVFLEANPSPMFLHFEKQTGFPITQELVQLLLN